MTGFKVKQTRSMSINFSINVVKIFQRKFSENIVLESFGFL